MKILTKYILKSVLGPLLGGVFIFTVMILGTTFINLLGEFESYHISLLTNLKLLSLYIPQNLLYGSTMAVLLATILGLGNLTSHSETIAMRAGGLSYFRLAAPVLFIGLAVSISGIILNEYATPYAYRMLQKMKAEIISEGSSQVIYNFNRPLYSSDGKLDKIIYAERFTPKTRQLENVLIVEKADGRVTRTIEAAVMHWDGRSWFFNQGRINQISPENLYPIFVKQAKVKYPLNITPGQIEESQIPPEEKSISELNRLATGAQKQLYLIYLYRKTAIPFASLIFALLGIPLALRPQRRTNAAGVGLCLLFVLVWWALYALGNVLARNGMVSPFIGSWLANFVMAGYGIYNFTKVKT